MAGDWIKMRTNLDSDPRVWRISAILGIPEVHVVGCLWKLWSWADEHTVDGNAMSVTKSVLDRYCGVTGFAQCLFDIGWLSGDDGKITFVNFDEHNGQTAKKRAVTAKRVAKHKENKQFDGDETANAHSVSKVTQAALPKGEERREEKNTVSKEQFLNWYAIYPLKKAKGAAEKAFQKAVRTIATERGVPVSEAVDLLKLWTLERIPQLSHLEGKYVPHPATWLNSARYEDAIEVAVSKGPRVLTDEEMEELAQTYNPYAEYE